MRLRQKQIAILSPVLAGICTAAYGQWNPATRFGPTPPTASADFGRAAAIDGDWAVVGAHRFGSSPSQAGAAFLYQRSGLAWSAAGMLQASDRSAADDFGGSVAIRGDWLAIGAPLDDPRGTNSGAAYLFQNGSAGWSQFAKLTASDGSALDQFGAAVALAQDWVMAGAPFDDDRGTDAGAVYLFHFDGQSWSQSGKLTPSPAGDQFGAALSASGDALVIGAAFNDDRGADSGAVYIFRRNGAIWVQEALLHASDGASGDRFGGGVSLDGDTLIVAASRDDRSGAIDHGSAYVFRRNGGEWTEQAKLVPADSAAGDFFGCSVSLRGDWALIGANFDDDRGTNSGSAYVFAYADGAWSQMQKFVADDGASQDWYGSAVALGEFVALIGAPGDDEGADAAGSMYLYGYTLPNSPPTCTLPPSIEVECAGASTTVALDGSGASDPDLDELGLLWSVNDDRATFDDPTAVMPNLHIPSGLACPFSCQVTLTVTDPLGETAECQMNVTVIDTTAPTLSCPPQAAAAAGGSIDPADVGAAEATDCDPQLSLTYSDETVAADCADRLFGSYVRRTWTATDHCGNSSTCEQMIGLQRQTMVLDIKPGDCPNTYNPRAKGKLKLALMGSALADGAMIDVASIRLRRADCQAGELALASSNGGSPPEIADIGTAERAADSPCPLRALDGFVDLALSFDSAAVDQALNLSSLGQRKVVLTVTGVLLAPGSPLDGVEFIANDAVELTPGSKPAGPRPGSGGGTKVEASPTPLPLEELPLFPGDCGAGAAMAIPLTLTGLSLMRRRRR